MNKEEIKVCRGCGHIAGDNLGITALACCPDSNFIPLREFISELWKDAYNSGSDNRKQKQTIDNLTKEVEFKNGMIKEAETNALIKFNQLEALEIEVEGLKADLKLVREDSLKSEKNKANIVFKYTNKNTKLKEQLKESKKI